ncbi:MAG: hypothetical protein EKK46_03865 [Rhodocyclaceae bacterium]|nr:MAG: hypothetical protein EKK46_03865 [Rhodocyclaceae bacterium]
MRRASRPFIALIASLLLAFAQQAAVAHMIGHGLGHRDVEAQNSIQQGEGNHSTAFTLSHVCTTCIAFSALDAFVPSMDLRTLSALAVPALFIAIASAYSSQRLTAAGYAMGLAASGRFSTCRRGRPSLPASVY